MSERTGSSATAPPSLWDSWTHPPYMAGESGMVHGLWQTALVGVVGALLAELIRIGSALRTGKPPGRMELAASAVFVALGAPTGESAAHPGRAIPAGRAASLVGGPPAEPATPLVDAATPAAPAQP